MRKTLLRIWLYGIPTAGFAVCMVIYAFGVPTDNLLRFLAPVVLLAMLVFVMRRASQLERSFGAEVLPSRFQLIFAGFLLGFIVLIMAFVAHWEIHKMAGISAPIMSLSTIPIAFVDQRKVRNGEA